jgi:hypothetical protein
MIGRYKLELHLFSKPDNLDKTPAVFLGGALYFFKTEVESVYQTDPVILLDHHGDLIRLRTPQLCRS